MARPPAGGTARSSSPPSETDPQQHPLDLLSSSATTSSSLDHNNASRNTQMQEAVVIKFAELLGKESKVGTEPDLSSARSMKGLFSKDVGEQEIVLVLPSLEIQLSENNGGGPLPDVGESRMNHRSGNNDMHDPATDGLAPPLPRKPTMTASVLTSAAKDAANAELEVAKSLEENSAWTKSTVGFAPSALVNNLSQSFSRLVGSRMKAWTLLLLRHSLSTGDESSRKRLLGILTAILKVESVATQFTTLSLPDSAKVHEKEADVILPLLFGATVTVTGQDGKKDDPVTVRAPGAISGKFEREYMILFRVLIFLSYIKLCFLFRLFASKFCNHRLRLEGCENSA